MQFTLGESFLAQPESLPVIGQNFNGSPFGYYDPNKKNLYLENKNKVINLPQRDGNFPAIQNGKNPIHV